MSNSEPASNITIELPKHRDDQPRSLSRVSRHCCLPFFAATIESLILYVVSFEGGRSGALKVFGCQSPHLRSPRTGGYPERIVTGAATTSATTPCPPFLEGFSPAESALSRKAQPTIFTLGTKSSDAPPLKERGKMHFVAKKSTIRRLHARQGGLEGLEWKLEKFP